MKGSRTDDDEFRIARSIALEAYSDLESSLAYLLGRLLGTTNDRAMIIFSRLTNASARNEILEHLLESVHGAKYDTYWHGQPGSGGQPKILGLFALIRQCDSRRNEVVHWHVASTSTSDGEHWKDLRSARSPDLKPLTTPDLHQFTVKAKFAHLSVFHFTQFTTKTPEVFVRSYGALETWTRIFAQPVPYPPSSDHPLAPKP
ncbi:MAG: hypothetical protein QOH67_1825 [Hyphomicrobiales bacterium]|jgi:hypothetical protein|nr:hypothetical protein [Hyphomicrobiales bacterium]